MPNLNKKQFTLSRSCWQSGTPLLIILPKGQSLALSPFLQQLSFHAPVFLPFYSLNKESYLEEDGYLKDGHILVQFPIEAPSAKNRHTFYSCLAHLQILLRKVQDRTRNFDYKLSGIQHCKSSLTLGLTHELLYDRELKLVQTLACHIPVRIQLNQEQFGWCSSEPETSLHPYSAEQNVALVDSKSNSALNIDLYPSNSFPYFEQLYRLLNQQLSLQFGIHKFRKKPETKSKELWQRHCPALPISPLAWDGLIRWSQSVFKIIPELKTDWQPANVQAMLFALATGCSYSEMAYLGGSASLWELQKSLQERLASLESEKQSAEEAGQTQGTATEQPVLADLAEFQPSINARFQYVGTEQLQKISLQQRGSISIYDKDGNASGPYSCKRVSEQEFQISNPYLGYQVSDYRLTGQQLVPGQPAQGAAPSLESLKSWESSKPSNSTKSQKREKEQEELAEQFCKLRELQVPEELENALQKHLGFSLRKSFECLWEALARQLARLG